MKKLLVLLLFCLTTATHATVLTSAQAAYPKYVKIEEYIRGALPRDGWGARRANEQPPIRLEIGKPYGDAIGSPYIHPDPWVLTYTGPTVDIELGYDGLGFNCRPVGACYGFSVFRDDVRMGQFGPALPRDMKLEGKGQLGFLTMHTPYSEFQKGDVLQINLDWGPSAIPEPHTWAMLSAGLLLVAGIARRRLK